MKRRWIVSTLVLLSLALLAYKVSRKNPAPVLAKTAAVTPVAKAEDVDRALEAVKKAPVANLDQVKKELDESNDEKVQESLTEYQEQEQAYDKSYRDYGTAHGAYQEALHAAEGGNGPDVEMALQAVDEQARLLQEETEKLNVKAAAFLEEYRRYTFAKMGLALN